MSVARANVTQTTYQNELAALHKQQISYSIPYSHLIFVITTFVIYFTNDMHIDKFVNGIMRACTYRNKV